MKLSHVSQTQVAAVMTLDPAYGASPVLRELTYDMVGDAALSMSTSITGIPPEIED